MDAGISRFGAFYPSIFGLPCTVPVICIHVFYVFGEHSSSLVAEPGIGVFISR